MKLEWLEGDAAVDEIGPIVVEQGWMPLNARTSRVVVARPDDGEDPQAITGFFALQLIPFLGPLWVAPTQRDGEATAAMVQEMRQFLDEVEARGFLVICESPLVERMCRKEGMKKIETPVYATGMWQGGA